MKIIFVTEVVANKFEGENMPDWDEANDTKQVAGQWTVTMFRA